VFKLYLKKLNGDSKPNIVPIVYADLPEILQFLTITLFISDESQQLKLSSGVLPQFQFLNQHNFENLEFWNPSYIFATDSGKFRLRGTTDYDEASKKVYKFYLNAPNLNPNLPDFLGPTTCLSRTELDQFFKAVGNIQSRCPPLDAMK